MKELLKLRAEMKARKPIFNRQDYPKKKALGEKCRRAAGIHSKRGTKFRGAGPYPSIGYRSPAKVRGLTPEGFKGIIVSSLTDLSKLTEKAAILSANVGSKKKISIIQEAKKLGIRILNIKDIDNYIKSLTEKVTKRKEEAKKRKDKKIKVQKKEEKVEKKEVTAEEKKKAEVEEKKKIIEGR